MNHIFSVNNNWQDTHESTDHRLVVMVEGWQKTSAISIDKVGLFFRTIFTDEHSKSVPKVWL